ncbi:hypothetical protein HDU67_001084 [Dinochytrium kinnereticum]|nr:hypothetical protein HDU67_001084 [Dinochytrium kinnereticum]
MAQKIQNEKASQASHPQNGDSSSDLPSKKRARGMSGAPAATAKRACHRRNDAAPAAEESSQPPTKKTCARPAQPSLKAGRRGNASLKKLAPTASPPVTQVKKSSAAPSQKRASTKRKIQDAKVVSKKAKRACLAITPNATTMAATKKPEEKTTKAPMNEPQAPTVERAPEPNRFNKRNPKRPVIRGIPGVYMTGTWENSKCPVGDGVSLLKCFNRIETLPDKVGKISLGTNHCLVISEDEMTVWSFGSNSDGALGRTVSDPADDHIPKPVVGLPAMKIKKAECYDGQSIFLMENGEVYRCGAFKTHDMDIQLEPKKVEGFEEPIVDVACGSSFVLALSKSGKLLVWGEAKNGKLAPEREVPTDVNAWKPYRIGAGLAKTDPTTGKSVPIRFTSVIAGDDCGFAIDEEMHAYAFGSNTLGNLSFERGFYPEPTVVTLRVPDGKPRRGRARPVFVSTPLHPVSSIATGRRHTIFLMENGQLYGSGANNTWQLGQGSGRVATGCSLCFCVIDIPKCTGIEVVGGGEGHCVASNGKGTLWTWGNGEEYQLGNGSFYPMSEPQICNWVAKTKKACDGVACYMEGMRVGQVAAAGNITMVVAEVE